MGAVSWINYREGGVPCKSSWRGRGRNAEKKSNWMCICQCTNSGIIERYLPPPSNSTFSVSHGGGVLVLRIWKISTNFFLISPLARMICNPPPFLRCYFAISWQKFCNFLILPSSSFRRRQKVATTGIIKQDQNGGMCAFYGCFERVLFERLLIYTWLKREKKMSLFLTIF